MIVFAGKGRKAKFMNPGSQVRKGRWGFVLFLLVLTAIFTALGVWQVKRLAWKEALIAKVEQRVGAPPVAAPDGAEARGDALSAREYLRVRVTGVYIPTGSALVRAVTDLGSGYWVMTPLRLHNGRLIYVNRGFVPVGSRLDKLVATTPQTAVAVTGLLRLSEPKGGFLRANRPEADQWYSRDVQALAVRRGLGQVAPFFLDAQNSRPTEPAGGPVPGLTVLRFTNNHLSYAITWFTMALLSFGLAIWVRRRESQP